MLAQDSEVEGLGLRVCRTHRTSRVRFRFGCVKTTRDHYSGKLLP